MIAGTSPSAARGSLPLVRFGREVCGDLPGALRREWLVTNGLGGLASGTVAGVATRRYHGLLVAALRPPVNRTVLLAAADERADYAGRQYGLSAHEFEGGVIAPHGYRQIESFRLEGMLPVWTFALADALLEKRVWMDHGANTTRLRYRVLRATAPVHLTITPLVTCRDFHSLSPWPDWRPEQVELDDNGFTIVHSAVTLRLLAEGGVPERAGDWWWDFHHREEAARGLDARAHLYAPARFIAILYPGEAFCLTVTAEPGEPYPVTASLDSARRRQSELLGRAEAGRAHPALRQLVLAADQFLVRRDALSPAAGAHAAAPPSFTVIAGYPWFNDWGRDTMIALPGLTLATGRAEEGAAILRAFAPYVKDGLCPNNFPDQSGAEPGYNTADATLWYFLAVRAHVETTGDIALVDDLLPLLRGMIEQHVAGTRYGIGMDPEDGLLRAGEPGMQLTWMDAKVGDRVVTPRTGKPVEINALWYNALRTIAAWLKERGEPAAAGYEALADRVRDAFRARFVLPDSAFLADVVDGPDGDDRTIRPNQIVAVSLPYPLLDEAPARALVDAVGRELLTGLGLRSLAQSDPAYRGIYAGGPLERDGSYHQGPSWTWLIGAFVDAHYRVYRDREAALSFLQPFIDHLCEAGLGSISELLDGDPPHTPRGCIAQAWGVAEVLRVWRMLDQPAQSHVGA